LPYGKTPLTVIPAQAEALYNSEAGQSMVNAKHGLTSFAVVKRFGLRRNDDVKRHFV
jgi:hypothetical protein